MGYNFGKLGWAEGGVWFAQLTVQSWTFLNQGFRGFLHPFQLFYLLNCEHRERLFNFETETGMKMHKSPVALLSHKVHSSLYY